MHALALFLFALNSHAAAPACPALTGDYVIGGNDGRVRVSIVQTGCTKIAISWTSTLTPPGARVVHALALNGAFHSDSGWYGATEQQMTAASFKNGVLEIAEKPVGRVRPIQWRGRCVWTSWPMATFARSSRRARLELQALPQSGRN